MSWWSLSSLSCRKSKIKRHVALPSQSAGCYSYTRSMEKYMRSKPQQISCAGWARDREETTRVWEDLPCTLPSTVLMQPVCLCLAFGYQWFDSFITEILLYRSRKLEQAVPSSQPGTVFILLTVIWEAGASTLWSFSFVLWKVRNATG